MTKLVTVVGRGVAASRPASGVPGQLYLSTDTGALEQWNGAAWVSYQPTGGAPGGAAGGVLGGTYPNPSFAADMATQAELDAAVATLQPLDSDLTAIAALTPSNDDVIQRKAGAWTNRTLTQLIADLIAVGAWTEAVQDVIGAMVAAAGGSYNDGANTITLPSSGGAALTVEEVDGSPTDSAVTKIVFPNGTLAIASHVATYTPTAGGALFLIQETILGSDGPLFTFNTALGGYRAWKLIGHFRGAMSSPDVNPVIVQFNGDTGAHYANTFMIQYSTFGGGHAEGQASMIIGTATKDAWPYWTSLVADVPFPDLVTGEKAVAARSDYRIGTGAGDFRDEHIRGWWVPTSNAAISAMTIAITGGLNFKAGSRFALYGIV